MKGLGGVGRINTRRTPCSRSHAMRWNASPSMYGNITTKRPSGWSSWQTPSSNSGKGSCPSRCLLLRRAVVEGLRSLPKKAGWRQPSRRVREPRAQALAGVWAQSGSTGGEQREAGSIITAFGDGVLVGVNAVDKGVLCAGGQFLCQAERHHPAAAAYVEQRLCVAHVGQRGQQQCIRADLQRAAFMGERKLFETKVTH